MATQNTKAARQQASGPNQTTSNVTTENIFAIQDFARSGLTPEDVNRLGIKDTDQGYEIPFFYPQTGQPMLTPDGRPFTRTRLKNPTDSAKYLSPKDGGIHCYILPEVDKMLKDSSKALVLTEGEKKAARAAKEAIPCIALAGIWMWKQNGDSDAINEDLKPYLHEGRQVVLIYDSDATEPKKAADFDRCVKRLAATLEKYGCKLTRLDLPQVNGEKTGLDDYLEAGYSADDLRSAIKTHGVDIPGAAHVKDTWPDLNELQLPSAPPFPMDDLPSALADQARQVAATMQVDPVMPGFAALTLAGFTLGKRTYVQPKRGVSARPNIYTLAFLDSGERKSSSYKPMMRPPEQFAERYREEWDQVKQQRAIVAKKMDKLQKQLADPDLSPEKQKKYTQTLNNLHEPEGSSPHFVVDNTTEEGMQNHLERCDERALLFSSDARDAIQVIQGLYNDNLQGNADTIYLKSYDGEPIHIERVSRGDITLNRPCLGIFLAIHTDQLTALGENRALLDSGFIPRFIMLVPEPQAGTRFWHEEELDEKIEEQYDNAILERLEKYRHQDQDFFYPLNKKARDLWIDWYNALEQDMGEELSGEQSLAIRWQSLPLRLAPILSEYEDMQEITADHMTRAINIASCAMEHGRRSFQLMQGKTVDRTEESAMKMLKKHGLKEFTVNDLAQRRHKSVDETLQTLQSLESRGIVRQTDRTRGHKKAQLWEAHPQLFT